jgi:manganese/zinc/iron transport system permease protein
MNYSNTDFFQFFSVLIHRFLGGTSWASDEVQLAVLVGVAINTASVGTFLVLRQMTMLANALSHTLLCGIVVAYLISYYLSGGHEALEMGLPFSAMLLAAFITAAITAWLTEFSIKSLRIQEDASIGLVFSALFALGILLVTLFTRNVHIGIDVIMGNADALLVTDIWPVWISCLCNGLLIALFFKEYQVTTFDPGFARTLGLRPAVFRYLLTLQAALSLIAAFRAIGSFLPLAFLVGPTLIARQYTHSLQTLLLGSICIGTITAIISVALSRHLLSVMEAPVSTGGLAVTVLVGFYILSTLFKNSKRLIK